MAIEFTCDCGNRYRANNEHAGHRGICPACKREFVFPGGTALASRRNAPVEDPPPASATQDLTPNADGTVSATDEVKPRPLWKDPVVVVGAAVPSLIILVFVCYLAWPQVRAWVDPDLSQKPKTTHSDSSVSANTAGAPRRNPRIPVEVSYPVTFDELSFDARNTPWRRDVRVHLNMKVSLDVLRAIALEIKSKESEQYDPTFIEFSLPPFWEKFPWAIATFRETLDVSIDGLTPEAERLLVAQPLSLPENSLLIGSWLADELDFRITIYRKDGKYYLQKFKPGKEGYRYASELKKLPSSDEPRFLIEKGPFGYHLDRWGGLEIMVEGVIGCCCRPVK